MKTEKMTKKQLVAETCKLLDELKVSAIRPAEVWVDLYRGCEKIGYGQLVWHQDGVIYCIADLLEKGFKTLMDNQLNSGNIHRIYQTLKEDYERE